MKLLIFTSILISITLYNGCQSSSFSSDLKQKFGECATELRISNGYSDVEKSRWKCFDFCMMSKFKFMSCGKITNQTAVIDYFENYTPRKIDRGFKEEIIRCMREANEESHECLTASAFSHCVLRV